MEIWRLEGRPWKKKIFFHEVIYFMNDTKAYHLKGFPPLFISYTATQLMSHSWWFADPEKTMISLVKNEKPAASVFYDDWLRIQTDVYEKKISKWMKNKTKQNQSF